MKTCTKCNESKEYNNFCKSKQKRDGYDSWCKTCVKDYKFRNKEKIKEYSNSYMEQYRKTEKYKNYHVEYGREYNTQNRQKLSAQARAYNEKLRTSDNSEDRAKYELSLAKMRDYQKAIRAKFPELASEKSKKYRRENPEKSKETERLTRIKRKSARNEHDKLKRQTDPQFNLKYLLRLRILKALKSQQVNKVGSAVKGLGCTAQELKLYLESRFYNNPDTNEAMTWDNHGLYGWHVDHKKPLASYDLSNPEQFKQACYYTNLQPLWAQENLSKGSKII